MKLDIFKILRQLEPQRIAKQLVSVQPIEGPIDWDALGEAYAALQALSGHRCAYDPLNKHNESD